MDLSDFDLKEKPENQTGSTTMPRAEVTPYTLIHEKTQTPRVPHGDSYHVEDPYGLYPTNAPMPRDLRVVPEGKRGAPFPAESNKDDAFALIPKKLKPEKYDLISPAPVKNTKEPNIYRAQPAPPRTIKPNSSARILAPVGTRLDIRSEAVPPREVASLPFDIKAEIERQVAQVREGLAMGNNVLKAELTQVRDELGRKDAEIVRLQQERDEQQKLADQRQKEFESEQQIAADFRTKFKAQTDELVQLGRDAGRDINDLKTKLGAKAAQLDAVQENFTNLRNDSVLKSELNRQLAQQRIALTEQLQERFNQDKEVDRRVHETALQTRDALHQAEKARIQNEHLKNISTLSEQLAQHSGNGNVQPVGVSPDQIRTIIQDVLSQNGHQNGTLAEPRAFERASKGKAKSHRAQSPEARQKMRDAYTKRQQEVAEASNRIPEFKAIVEDLRAQGKTGFALINEAHKQLQQFTSNSEQQLEQSQQSQEAPQLVQEPAVNSDELRTQPTGQHTSNGSSHGLAHILSDIVDTIAPEDKLTREKLEEFREIKSDRFTAMPSDTALVSATEDEQKQLSLNPIEIGENRSDATEDKQSEYPFTITDSQREGLEHYGITQADTNSYIILYDLDNQAIRQLYEQIENKTLNPDVQKAIERRGRVRKALEKWRGNGQEKSSAESSIETGAKDPSSQPEQFEYPSELTEIQKEGLEHYGFTQQDLISHTAAFDYTPEQTRELYKQIADKSLSEKDKNNLQKRKILREMWEREKEERQKQSEDKITASYNPDELRDYVDSNPYVLENEFELPRRRFRLSNLWNSRKNS